MRTLLAVAFLLTVIGFAHAQFRPAPKPEIGGMYECAVMADLEEEDDPFYKVMIYIEIQDSKLSSLTVDHVSASGRRVSRSDQYTNGSLSYEPEKMKVTWVGQWTKNPKVKMTGTFMFSDGKWRYHEYRSDSGRRPIVKSVCHQTGPEC